MDRLIHRIVQVVTGCDESLRIILTTAALVALIMGGIALNNFYGGLLTGLGLGIILVSLFGVVYEQYVLNQAKTIKNSKNLDNSA